MGVGLRKKKKKKKKKKIQDQDKKFRDELLIQLLLNAKKMQEQDLDYSGVGPSLSSSGGADSPGDDSDDKVVVIHQEDLPEQLKGKLSGSVIRFYSFSCLYYLDEDGSCFANHEDNWWPVEKDMVINRIEWVLFDLGLGEMPNAL